MVRYKLILAYDGTAFAGSQRQASHRTVQGELEKALHELGWSGRSVTLAGRTDTGVHASGQVAAFDFEWDHGLEHLRDALNANLPVDIAVKNVEVADAKFHPRFDACVTLLSLSPVLRQHVRDPLREKMAWRVWPAFNADMLVDVAKVFLGQHDFSAFGSPSSEQGSSTVRTVTLSEWTRSMMSGSMRSGRMRSYIEWFGGLVFVQVAVAQGKCLKEICGQSFGQTTR